MRFGLVTVAALALAGCSGSGYRAYSGGSIPKGGGAYKVGQPYRLNGRTYYPGEDPNYRAEGIASWYGPDFHGKQTANGEVYDMHGISAAHPTLPIPSYARVTNLRNGRSIVVRVNDRGPFVGNRLIDVSIGAAKALEFHGEGLARVRVEYLGRAPLEGSDDRVLLATLRQGSPAPAPAGIMVASAGKPPIPAVDEAPRSRAEAGPPTPPGRPFAVGGSKTANVAGKTTGPDAPGPALAQAQAKVVTLPVKPRRDDTSDPSPGPSSNQAPATLRGSGRPDGSLGLMSGRGLY